MKIWFTSDTHYHHGNVVFYAKRPFSSPCSCKGEDEECLSCKGYGVIPDVQLMNETMINNWNNVISPEDTIYHIGDFALQCDKKEVTKIAKRLNGHIHWVWGNHDDKRRNAEGFAWQGYYKEINYNGLRFILCHYPFGTWNGCHRGSVNIHGHSHGQYPDDGTKLQFDVGVDCFDFKPVLIDDIVKKVEKRKKSNLKNYGKKIMIRHH